VGSELCITALKKLAEILKKTNNSLKNINIMKKNIQEDTQFLVALEGLELSKEQINRIKVGIKSVVMNEVAAIDTKGDLLISDKVELNSKISDLPILVGMTARVHHKFRQ